MRYKISELSVNEWASIAQERASDSRILLEGSRDIAAIYMAGYAVECALKAYNKSIGRKFPKSGSHGHNLKELWKITGFRKSDFMDVNGEKTFFLEFWSVDFRYQIRIKTTITTEELVKGAGILMSWLITRSKRKRIRGH